MIHPGTLRTAALVAVLLAGLTLTACTLLRQRVNYAGPNNISVTSVSSPLPDEAFRAAIELAYPEPLTLNAGYRTGLHFIVTNKSNSVWPAGQTAAATHQLSMGNHWRDEHGTILVMDDARSSLPYDLHPGGRAEILLQVSAPDTPGRYVLEIDLAQEQVAWFAQKGSQTLRLNVTVK